MLEVSSIQIAAIMLTLVGMVDAVPYEVDSFNDRTDGQSRRPTEFGERQLVPQDHAIGIIEIFALHPC